MAVLTVPPVAELLAGRLDPHSDLWRNLMLLQGASMWPLSIEDCRKDLRGRNMLITGGNTGIGYFVVEHFVSQGCNVMIACREGIPNEPQAGDVLRRLNRLRKHSDQSIEVWQLDCASLKSVKALAQRFLATKRPLHYLYANAGICLPPLAMTEEGFERHWVLNYLSHFTLVLSLLPALKQADAARVVQASSVFHYFGGQLDFALLNSLKAEKWQGLDDYLMKYGRSKLALCMFGKELNDRLAKDPATAHIIVLSLHPGSVYSGIFKALQSWDAPVRSIITFVGGMLSMSPKTGSKSMIKAGLSDADDRGTRGGRYWNRGWETSPRPEVNDPAQRKKLWELSLEWSGLHHDVA